MPEVASEAAIWEPSNICSVQLVLLTLNLERSTGQTFRKVGAQSYRSKGKSYDSGVATNRRIRSIGDRNLSPPAFDTCENPGYAPP